MECLGWGTEVLQASDVEGHSMGQIAGATRSLASVYGLSLDLSETWPCPMGGAEWQKGGKGPAAKLCRAVCTISP